jgi:trk system potassium uptake protein TrkH
MRSGTVREREYLRRRYGAILSYTGVILAICGVIMLSPLLLLTVYPEEAGQAWAFAAPALALVGLGVLAWKALKPSKSVALTVQEGGVIVLLSWVTVILFSAWPFMRLLGLDFTRAVFESVSGWTTTGLSVVDVTKAGKMVLLWRSTMQLFGGAGLAILMMSAIIGPTGAGLSAAEGRGEQLVPHVRQSARLVMLIYGGYVAAGIIALSLAGMSPFDAVNHTFTAVSTGGFSTRPESIGFWNSPTIEAIIIALMMLGNLSFVTAWLALRGEFRFVLRNGEVRLFAVLAPLATAAVFLVTSQFLYPHLGKAFRVALFESVSALTTTGFSTVTYNNWNSFGALVLIMLMLVGGGTCSTAGGIKQFRIYLLSKQLAWEMKRAFLPRTAVLERPIWEADRKIFLRDARFSQISIFVFLYMMVFFAGVLILCACGYSVQDSMFEFASSLGTVGLSIGVTTVKSSNIVLWSESAAMFLGRLEFFVIIVSALRLVADIRRMVVPSRMNGEKASIA